MNATVYVLIVKEVYTVKSVEEDKTNMSKIKVAFFEDDKDAFKQMKEVSTMFKYDKYLSFKNYGSIMEQGQSLEHLRGYDIICLDLGCGGFTHVGMGNTIERLIEGWIRNNPGPEYIICSAIKMRAEDCANDLIQSLKDDVVIRFGGCAIDVLHLIAREHIPKEFLDDTSLVEEEQN